MPGETLVVERIDGSVDGSVHGPIHGAFTGQVREREREREVGAAVPADLPSVALTRARHDEVIVTHVDGEILIADLSYRRLHWLNGIATLIWGLCDGTTSIAVVRAKLRMHGPEQSIISAQAASVGLNAPGLDSAVDDIVWLAVLRFQHRGLLHDAPSESAPFAEAGPPPTRRALARRVRAAGLGKLDPVVRSAPFGAAIHAEGFGPYRHADEPCGVAQPPCSPGLRCHTLGQPIGACV